MNCINVNAAGRQCMVVARTPVAYSQVVGMPTVGAEGVGRETYPSEEG